MAKKLSPIVAQVTMDLNKWSAGVKQMQRDQDALTKSLKPLNQALGTIGKPLLAVGGALSALFVGLAKKAADYGDEMLEASQKTGIGTKQLAALRLVAEQSGSSFEGITAGATKLSKSLFEASTKGGEAAKTFAALGISVKDASGSVRQASDVLPEIADRFAKMKDGTEKSAIAMRLLGKAGADLIPTLNQGAAGFKAASEAVDKFNVDIGDAGNKLGDEFNDELKLTGLAVQGLSNQVGVALLPAMIKLVQVANNVIAAVAKWAKEHPGLTRAIAATSVAMMGAGGLIVGAQLWVRLAPEMISGARMLGQAFMALSVPLRVVIGAVAVLTAAFLAFPQIRKPIIETIAVINQALFAWVDGLGRVVGVLVTLTQGKFTDAFETLKDLPQQMADSWTRRGDMVRDAAKSIGDGISSINKAASATPDNIKVPGIDISAFEKDASKVADTIETMWKSLKRESGEAEALTAVLMRASAAHIDLDTVLDKLGPTISDVADEFRRAGEPLPDIIAQYDFLRRNSALLAAQYEEEMIARQELNRTIFEGEKMMADELKRIQKEANQEVVIDRPANDFGLILVENTKRIRAQQAEVVELARQMIQLRNAGYTTAQIEAALGVRMEDVTERARELGVELDKTTRKTLDQAARAQNLQRSWGDAMGSMVDGVVDMVVDFDFSFKRLGDIAKNTAKSMARSFLDGFFKPFKDGLRNLGEEAGKWASGLIFGSSPGASNQQGGGLLGGILGGGSGGILGGIFGGNGGSGGILGGIFGGGGGTGSPGIAGGIFGQSASGIMGTMNPIAAGASIANQVFDLGVKITDKIGKGRDSANEVIKSQEAFVNQTLKGILDDASLSATNKLKLVSNEFDIFNQNLARYSAGGGENPVTANQAFATVAPLVARIKTDLIKQGATDAMGGTGDTYHISVSITTTDEIRHPEDLVRIIEMNKGGVTSAMAKAVINMEGAIVTR